MKKGSPRDPCLPSRFNRKPRIRCKTSTRKPPTRKPPTRKPPRPRQKLDNNGRKIDANVRKINAILADGRKIEAILENVSDLKNNTSKKENDDYEYGPGSGYEYGSGYEEWLECYVLSSCDGPKTKSKLLGRKLDTILENMSDLKTTIYNALNGKMHDAKQNEDNPSTKPAKNLPNQELKNQRLTRAVVVTWIKKKTIGF